MFLYGFFNFYFIFRYPYLAIPAISYPQLENELFCHIYYLRHLCDTQKFPNWPIADPVQLLKHTLDAWRKEVEKKPPQMTVQQAYNDLGIDLNKHPKPDESMIRKSYYRLAQMYHPDKNPNGREIFEKVNQAYEFLCSRNVWSSGGPDPNNIVLILRTQSILFERYADGKFLVEMLYKIFVNLGYFKFCVPTNMPVIHNLLRLYVWRPKMMICSLKKLNC